MTAEDYLKLYGAERVRSDLRIVIDHGYVTFFTPQMVMELIALVNKQELGKDV